MSIENKLEKILKKVLKTKNLKNVTSKNYKKWDSITQMIIVMEIEENFKIQLSEKEIYNLNTVDKIKKILKKKIKIEKKKI